MHIRKLEIHGFKSFPDRVSFHFGPGISGVVGPNGCGKSNVVDAVKWCLGEQSARSLRGAQMVDIIFAGTQERPATGMAEVSLTFAADGEPFPGEYARHAELQITRRLFRDGRGEYRINGARCRLKDVQDLFLDTGANNRLYSFIEQGRIGQIIAARPEERRQLIEEAAGISRFKSRRDEAELRLQESSRNLEDVSRTLDELAARLRSLDRQVRKAARHRRLKARIRQAEILLGLARFAGLVADRKVLSERARQAEHAEADAIRAATAREQELGRARAVLADAEERALARRDELAELEARRRESESARTFQAREAEELGRRVLAAQAEQARAAAQRTAAQARADEARRQGEELDRQLQQLAAALDEARIRQETREAALRARRARIEQAKDRVLQAVKRLARERAELDAAALRHQELLRRGAQVEARAEQVGSSLEQLEQAVARARGNLQASEERAAACREALAAARAGEAEERSRREGARAEVVAAAAALDRENRAVAEAERALAAAEARRESLEALLRAHDGVDDAARRVLDGGGCLGTLAEQLDVPAELDAPLALALGPALEAVLVPDRAQALRSLERVGEGRLALLALECLSSGDVVGGSPLAPVDGSPAGIDALRRLLGAPLLAASPEEALEIWAPGRTVLVLGPRPLVIDPRGLLTTGRISSPATALLQRRRQIQAAIRAIEPLAAQVKAATAAREQAAARLDRARQGEAAAAGVHEQARRRVEQAQTAASEAEVALRLAQREVQDAEKARQAEAERQERLRRDRAELEAQRASLEGTIQGLRARLEEGEAAQAEAEHSLRSDQAALPDEERAAEAAREERTRQSSAQAAAVERRRALTREEGAAKQAAEEAAGRQEASAQALRRAEERIEVLRAEDERLGRVMQELIQRQAEVDASLQAEREAVRRRRAEIEVQEAELRRARETQTRASAERAELDRRLATVKAEIQSIRDNLEERHELNVAGLLDRLERNGHVMLAGEEPGGRVDDEGDGPCEELRVTRATLEDEAGITARVAALKADRQALERLGEVNLLAWQEHAELSERHRALDEQRADLEESVRAIRQVIAGLNRTCRERFRETFDRVNAGFQEIYPRLVGGGTARLLLTQEEDLLVTGVDIAVQPPGKKLQQLTLLSGGEMAMAAIALIFALFRVKPSPFCLLDEVDAPLDEGNGARFNQTLREMARFSQFIVITHNKKTMECADTLYGVTMVVPGVSRLVSVQLEGGA